VTAPVLTPAQRRALLWLTPEWQRLDRAHSAGVLALQRCHVDAPMVFVGPEGARLTAAGVELRRTLS
jgi:hypothetical protein